MRNADLKRVVGLFLDATFNVVTSARGPNGSCRFCRSPRGIQHDPSCCIWGLINARITHHLLTESPAGGRVGRSGREDATPTAPTLTFSQNTASDEKRVSF